MNIFHARILELLGNKKPAVFARECGIPQQSMDRYVSGKSVAKADAILKICTHCRVSADWLLGLADAARPGGVSVKAGDGSAIASESPGAYVQAGATSAHESDQPQIARLLSIIESQQRVIENLSGSKK